MTKTEMIKEVRENCQRDLFNALVVKWFNNDEDKIEEFLNSDLYYELEQNAIHKYLLGFVGWFRKHIKKTPYTDLLTKDEIRKMGEDAWLNDTSFEISASESKSGIPVVWGN